MRRRALSLLLATGLLACDRPVPPEALRARLAETGPPNLVLVVVDTLRADRTSPYGFEIETTPELSRWAARGVVFERARAQSSWTKISMASLMTSLWPRSHGIREAEDGLADEALTLAEVLREAGYRTYGVQTNGWLHQSFGFHQGFDRYAFPRGGGGPQLERASVWPHAERVYDEAVRLVEAHDGSAPFFLYLHFMDVHEYAAPPEFQAFGHDSRGAYLAAIRWVDHTLERLREKLDSQGILDRTVLVFAADHGETFGEHGIHGHARNVLTPVLSVPLVVRFPFAIEPVRIAAQVRNLDVAPSLLDLAGIPVPPVFEGRSFVPLVGAEEEPSERPSFAALGVPLFADASVQAALTDGVWTFAHNTPSGDEAVPYAGKAVAPGAEFLFDRRIDPGENVNLVALEPEAAARMRDALASHQAAEPAGVVERDVRIDPGIAERLRAMGYLR